MPDSTLAASSPHSDGIHEPVRLTTAAKTPTSALVVVSLLTRGSARTATVAGIVPVSSIVISPPRGLQEPSKGAILGRRSGRDLGVASWHRVGYTTGAGTSPD